MSFLVPQLKKFLSDERGATALEYGLIVGLISVSLILVFTQLGDGIGNIFNANANALDGAE